MRLLVVSNRLPIVTLEEQGQVLFRESAGGLVSGISAYLDSLRGSAFAQPDYRWIGWPGVTIDDPAKQSLTAEKLSALNAYPVFLSENSMDKFYHGFCNKTIWPLFHYFSSFAVYEESLFAHYQCVNRIFCEAVARIMQPDDVIWIHDYHLMLLPRLLREIRPSAQIGFFLHIPFPDFEMFRLLPRAWRSEILRGLLGADLIGFHTYDYTHYFLRCVLRILGYEHHMGRILLPDHVAKVDTLPMGIDFRRFDAAAADLQTPGEEEDPWAAIRGFKVILSVDRLDYSKGILNRLRGYELFLENNPHWHGKVILALVVVPSRIGVDRYQTIKRQIDELVGKINGKFSTAAWTPVLYQYRYLPFKPLVSLYAASHVALITPLRDGLNLVAKEYLASRTDKTGVLILSETTGASQELTEAVIINPNTTGEIAAALKTALEMPEDEQIRRNEAMRDRLRRHDVVRWAEAFLTQLPIIKDEQTCLHARTLGRSAGQQVLEQFRRASRRTIFLDYDGTLAVLVDNPQDARPTEDVLAVLRGLARNPRNDVILASGRDKNTMQSWFGALDVAIVAEHGAWIRARNDSWRLAKPLDDSWKSAIVPMLETYADRLPGASVEEKRYSAAWHYRRADPELASARVRELVDELMSFTANMDVQVLRGNKVVEVRCGGVNKGAAAMAFIAESKPDFILAIGDDLTDEDLFQILPDSACSIKVGTCNSRAKFSLRNHMEVLELLRSMAADPVPTVVEDST